MGTHADLQGWDIHSKYHVLLEYVESLDEDDAADGFEQFVADKAAAENQAMEEDDIPF